VIISAASFLAFGVIAVESLNLTATHAVIEHQRNAHCTHVQTLRTGGQWLQSVKFPYIASRERVEQVIDNYDRVQVGSSERQVIEAFGPPDFNQDLVPKEPWRPCVGYDFVYYFQKSSPETDNMLEDNGLSKIEVSFTPDGEVYRIGGTVVGLQHKGSSTPP
jgi:hypothetical protein